jgi:hypothetical protein
MRKREKQKLIFEMLLLAESSFAIDVQQDKRAALGGCHLGCSCSRSQRTNTATCFWHHTHASRHNPHQSKRCLSPSARKKNEKNIFGMLLLAESSFAIDVQQDKRAALGHWHLGCR